MQAVTVAIGPAGVAAFTKQLLATRLVSTLSGLKPPDRDLTVPNFFTSGFGYTEDVKNIRIGLSQGSLTGFAPAFQSQMQNPGGTFTVKLSAPAFSVNYSWHETAHVESCFPSCSGSNCSDTDEDITFGYYPAVASLDTTVTLGFVYDQPSNSYQVNVASSSGQPGAVTANIPGKSIITGQDPGCFTSHVSDTTANAIAAIPFGTMIATLFPALLKSIPASGQLTPDIRYDFAVGDSAMTFPGDAGIAIGVTGTVKYKDQAYPGTAPKALPVPPPPAAPDHVQVYVSDYELNALHWAYFQAGLLAVTVHPTDLQDPDVLKVKTYLSAVKAFQPYAADAMTAHVVPKTPPVVAFADVYELTGDVMNQLKSLPTDVYPLLGGMAGNAYAALADLEADLQSATVPKQYWATIESAAKSAGMVVTQNLEFTLTIENGAQTPPVLVFDLQRTDILQKLGLGLTAGGAQTLQYAFQRASYAATFVSTTVPNFDRKDFGDFIWPTAGEPRYEDALAAMGKTGVPLPMMNGFHFVFDQAKLSIQEGYVSVLSQVTFTPSAG